MRLRNIAFMTVVMFFTLSGPVASSDWMDIKNAKDLRALFSNKTFRSTVGGVPVVEHYRSDGKGILIAAESRVPRTWEVKGKDQCVYPTRRKAQIAVDSNVPRRTETSMSDVASMIPIWEFSWWRMASLSFQAVLQTVKDSCNLEIECIGTA